MLNLIVLLYTVNVNRVFRRFLPWLWCESGKLDISVDNLAFPPILIDENESVTRIVIKIYPRDEVASVLV